MLCKNNTVHLGFHNHEVTLWNRKTGAEEIKSCIVNLLIIYTEKHRNKTDQSLNVMDNVTSMNHY